MKCCTYCQRKFQKTEHLARHQRSHTGERPFSCSKCGRRYSRRDVLQRHLKLHHRQEAVAISEQQPTRDTLSGKSGQSVLEQERPRLSSSESRVLGAALTSVRPRTPSPVLADQASISRQDASVISYSRSRDTVERPRSGSLHDVSTHAVSAVPESSRQRMTLPAELATTPTPHWTLNSANDMGLQTGMLYSSIENDYVQRQFSMMDNTCMGDAQLSTDMLDFLSTSTSLFEFGGFATDRSRSAKTQGPQLSITTDRASAIPTERFAQVARIWQNKMAAGSNDALRDSLWAEVVGAIGDSICTEPSISEPLTSSTVGDQSESKWGLDEDKRQSLIREFSLYSESDPSSSPDCWLPSSSFPPTRLLNIGLDIAFRQPHSLLPYIHRPTFSAKTASNSIVLSLCLLGLAMLNSRPAREFTLAYLPVATEKCCVQLSKISSAPGGSLKLITNLVTATLLLTTWSICPSIETHDESLLQMLHNQTVSRTKIAGLLLPRAKELLVFKDLLDQIEARESVQSVHMVGEDALWKAWARVESVKRLVSMVVMLDAWSAHTMNLTPGLRTQNLGLEMPGSTSLFQSASAKGWSRLIHEGACIFADPVLFQARPLLVVLPAIEDPSPVGMVGLLSTVWISVQEVRIRALPEPYVSSNEESPGTPGAVHASDESGKRLGFILGDIYARYSEFLRSKNPNCLALWHFLNLNLLANVSIFELAAGHSGAERARAALQDIAEWCQTREARRACLHATGIYSAMSRRRINDGTMFHSEASLFVAALVLSLYVFMMHPSEDPNAKECGVGSTNTMDTEPYELLQEIDWLTLRADGLGLDAPTSAPPSSSREVEVPTNTSLPEVAARDFITNGGPVSFSGFTCVGGYNASKMILHEFASLLEEIGKWKAKQFSHILRIMSDTLLDMDDIDEG